MNIIKDPEMIGGRSDLRVLHIQETVEAEAIPAGARLVTSLQECGEQR